MADYKDERLLTMAVPEDRPEIAALKNDITIPTALITEVPFSSLPFKRTVTHSRCAAKGSVYYEIVSGRFLDDAHLLLP